ncbi:hypothetical protein ACLMJK_004630 [Lecanora helva]
MADTASPTKAQKRRAPAPYISSDQLRTTRNVLGNGPNTDTPGFLSPLSPSLNPETSPPPKPESDDYFNNAHHGKRSQKKRERVSNDMLGENREPAATQESSLPRSLSRVSPSSECEDCVAKTTQAYTISARSESSNEVVIDSPAMTALRRVSQPQIDTQPGLQGLRRMSTALANTMQFLKSRTSSDVRDVSPRRRRGSHKKRSSRKSLGGDLPIKQMMGDQSSLATPSSITLRKASNARVLSLPRSSMSASLVHEDERLRSQDAPASELLAFYSANPTQQSQVELSHKRSAGVSDQSVLQVQEPIYSANEESDYKAPASSANPLVPRRNSGLAATILTFTDVHLAPGTFAVEWKPPDLSSAAADRSPRRISVVQFRSRNSVHEVVWREDETTSGSSLNSTSRTSQSPPQGAEQIPSDSPEVARSGEQNMSTPFHSASVSSAVREPQSNLFQWSWTKSGGLPVATSQGSEREDVRRPSLMRTASASNPDLNSAWSFPSTRNLHGRSVSENQDILSFPPLRDRKSTLEWCTPPKVDPDKVDQAHPHSAQAESSSASSSSSDGGPSDPKALTVEKSPVQRERSPTKRANSHPYAIKRLGRYGSMGSSLGASAHVRVARSQKF